jgi:hypothetical protein
MLNELFYGYEGSIGYMMVIYWMEMVSKMVKGEHSSMLLRCERITCFLVTLSLGMRVRLSLERIWTSPLLFIPKSK